MEQTSSRRERERLMRRQAMLEAAQAVFAEKGYVHATLDEVAHRAEFGKGTLYNYFEGGKEEIFFAIFDDFYDAFCQLIEQAFEPYRAGERPFRDVFHAFVRSCIAFFGARRDQFLLMIKEAQRLLLDGDHQKAAYFQQQAERTVGVLVPHLEAAMARGELRPLPARAVAYTVFGNLKGYYTHAALQVCPHGAPPHAQITPDEAADFITTLMLDGLLPRPGARDSFPTV